MTTRVDPTPALLHNMSAPPRTQISHQGARPVLRELAVRMPEVPSHRGGPALGVLAAAGVEVPAGTSPEQHLYELLNRRAAELGLPAMCPVNSVTHSSGPALDDVLDAVAVLSRSSDHVFLRDREPNLSRLRPGRVVVLLLPTEGGRR